MADWYVSSTAYAAVPTWAASTAYSIGQFVKPTAPNQNQRMVYRCTTAGTTAASEPSWNTVNNTTTTSNTAVFTNVTGQSTYGWSAAAGYLTSIVASRPVPGDRVFVSSDHSELISAGFSWAFNGSVAAHGLIQLISVNKAGSVPPVAADVQNGATMGALTSGAIVIDAYCSLFWQGFTLAAVTNINFNSGGDKAHYYRNCTFQITGSTASSRIGNNSAARVTLDNTTVQFGIASHAFGCIAAQPFEVIWLNTPSAIAGATIPTALFVNANASLMHVTCRGVDLSAITTTLLSAASTAAQQTKVLLDSCKIASGVTRYGTPAAGVVAHDEIELVNCYNGTAIVNERHTAAGSVTTDTATYMTDGAEDYVGAYSLKLASSSRSDYCTLPLDAFWLDVGNSATGSSKTATVEVISSASLNNTDIKLLLEYPDAALAQATVWDSASAMAVTLSGGGLVATNTGTTSADQGAHVHAAYARDSGKYYFEVTNTTQLGGANRGVGIGTAASTYTNMGNSATIGNIMYFSSGTIYANGSSTGISISPVGGGVLHGIAVDLDNRKIWFRSGASGNWNSNATYNPATNVGGITIPSGVMVPFVVFGGGGGVINNVVTANFGASAFTGTVPSGFTSGWSSTDTNMADFTESLSSVLATSAALPSSSATWTGPASTSWNQYDMGNSALTNNNLTATNTATNGNGRALVGVSTGKYYWEFTFTNFSQVTTGVGLGSGGSQLVTSLTSGPVTAVIGGGTIYVNGSSFGSFSPRANGDVIGVAVDLTANLIWYRVAPSGNWNISGTANPATGTGGIDISVLSKPLFPIFVLNSTAGQSLTANFGASAFSGAVPSGFTSGWPGTPSAKQSLQATFTPQRAGRVRGLVRLGKTSTTAWINPKVSIT